MWSFLIVQIIFLAFWLFCYRMDKGKALKASYIHSVNPLNGTVVAAEMTHRFSSYQNSFTIGSSHAIDPSTRVKTRFSDNGKVAMLCQREWRPKSIITVSAEYDSKSPNASPKFGLALALKPWKCPNTALWFKRVCFSVWSCCNYLHRMVRFTF